MDAHAYCAIRSLKRLSLIHILIDVIRLRRLKEDEKVSRELVLVKVECSPKTRSDIIDIVRVMDAKVSDLSKTTLTAELSAQTETVSYTHLDVYKRQRILSAVPSHALSLKQSKNSEESRA